MKITEIEKLNSIQSTAALLLISLFSSLVAFVVSKDVVSSWQWEVVAVFCIVFFIVLYVFKNISMGMMALIRLIIGLLVITASCMYNYNLAYQDQPFSQFEGIKILSLIVAIIASKPIWVGYTLFVICGLAPVFTYLSLPPNLQAHFNLQEPWLTFLYSVVGAVIFSYRISSLELLHYLTIQNAQKESLDRFAKVVLALRDLSNSPLQTLITSNAMLRAGGPKNEKIVQVNDQALNRLLEINEILAGYRDIIPWSEYDENFDSLSFLKEQQFKPQENPEI